MADGGCWHRARVARPWGRSDGRLLRDSSQAVSSHVGGSADDGAGEHRQGMEEAQPGLRRAEVEVTY